MRRSPPGRRSALPLWRRLESARDGGCYFPKRDAILLVLVCFYARYSQANGGVSRIRCRSCKRGTAWFKRIGWVLQTGASIRISSGSFGHPLQNRKRDTTVI